MIRFIATPTISQDIKPGQLFSLVPKDSNYWDHIDPEAIAVRVYIRTDAPTPSTEMDRAMFVITTEEVPS